MEVPGTRFTAHNSDGYFEAAEEIHDYFTLEAPQNTLIWRKMACQDHVSAPMVLTTARMPFYVAEVTVSVDLEMEWDQAGLVLFTDFDALLLRHRRMNGQQSSSSSSGGGGGGGGGSSSSKWIKVGLGLSSHEPGLCTVLANPNCGPDSAFTPTDAADATDASSCRGQPPSMRVKLERVNEDLWVWYRIPGCPAAARETERRSPAEVSLEWRKIRQVTGFFAGLGKEATITVGCYASRPMPLDEDDRSTLFAEFADLEIL